MTPAGRKTRTVLGAVRNMPCSTVSDAQRNNCRRSTGAKSRLTVSLGSQEHRVGRSSRISRSANSGDAEGHRQSRRQSHRPSHRPLRHGARVVLTPVQPGSNIGGLIQPCALTYGYVCFFHKPYNIFDMPKGMGAKLP